MLNARVSVTYWHGAALTSSLFLGRLSALSRLTFLALLLTAVFWNLPSVAAVPTQPVYDAPGGAQVDTLQTGDQTQILEYQTVYRGGVNERWAFIAYGASNRTARGWINLDYQRPAPRQQQQQQQQNYYSSPPERNRYAAPPARSGSDEAEIRDMDISCYHNSRGSIQGCNLSVEVQLSANRFAYANEILVQCQAELHWFAVGGGTRISGSQAGEYINLNSGSSRTRILLNFDFGQRGATGAMVENQQCQTQTGSSSYDRYPATR